jgi:protein translocase SecG subunit
MSFIVGILTFFLVVNCLLLILLVLIQLPKKDAGAGLAFGGGAADALFGAGSGNALTKITKYATVVFLVLALFLGYLQDSLHKDNSAQLFAKEIQQKQMQAPVVAPVQKANPPAATPANNLLTTTPNLPVSEPTTTPAVTGTNAPVK